MPATVSAERLVGLLLVAAGAIFFLSFGNTEMAGGDLWWHLAAGRELVQSGSPWMVDSWSYTAHGEQWRNHEWLSDLIYYAWIQQFGIKSLVYWKWLTILATYGLLQLVLFRYCENQLAAFFCAIIAIVLGAPFLDLRPHLYSLLGFSALLFLALQGRPRRWQLALLFLVWVNLHGGFFFGLMALAILLLPWRDFHKGALQAAVLTGAICLAASLLNPSGIFALVQPLVYALDASSPYRELGEWHSPFRAGGIQSPLFLVFVWFPLLALAYLLPAIRSRIGVPWEAVLLTLLTLAMALTSRRFIPLYGMSLALLLAPLLGLALGAVRSRTLLLLISIMTLALACVRVAPYSFQPGSSFHYLVAEYSFPENTVDFMVKNSLQGNVFALYKWGGYLHWRTDGAARVFVDGRANTVYDDQTFSYYIDLLRSDTGWVEAIEATGADYILWSNTGSAGAARLAALNASGRWHLLYRDAVSWLAVRSVVADGESYQDPTEFPLYPLTLAAAAGRKNDTTAMLQHAGTVRRELPWQRSACQLEVRTLVRVGEQQAATNVLADCLGYFPTRFLP